MRVLLLCAINVIIVQSVEGTRKNPSEIPKGSLNSGKCRFIFNEINFFPSGNTQFLELKRVCDEPPTKIFKTSMKIFKIIFFTHDAKLIGVCKLGSNEKSQFATKREGDILFYTIGGSAVPNTDMSISECDFAEEYVQDRFPVGEFSPVAVALLSNKEPKSLEGIELQIDELTQKKKATEIRFSMEQVIQKNLQDFYILASSTPFTGCKYFENFYTGYSIESRSFLRDWGQYDESMLKSLSRCKVESISAAATDWVPFQPDHFRLTKSTPGQHNSCENSVRFIIEDDQPQRKKPRYDFSGPFACKISTEDKAIEDLYMIANPFEYEAKLRNVVNSATLAIPRQGASSSIVSPDRSQVQMPEQINFVDYFTRNEPPVASQCQSKPAPLSDTDFQEELNQKSPFIWNDCSRFQHTRFLEAIKADTKNAPINEDYISEPKVCTWLDWLPDKKKFRCQWCHRLWNQNIIFDGRNHITKLISDGQGYGGVHGKYDNKRILEQHLKTSLHELAEEYHRLHDSGKRGNELQSAFEAPEGPYRRFLNKTENRFVTVFQAVKMDLPFFKYPMLTDLLSTFGIDAGKLYNSRTGMKTITLAISNKLHHDVCEYLRSTKPKVSLLIDTSSDVSSTYSMAILFQTFDINGAVKTVFYKLLHVPLRETTENLYNLIIQALEDDNLLEYIKGSLTGFGTDGGANVKKIKDKFDEITKTNLIYVYCQAHKLERAVKHAWDADELLNEADALVNSLHSTFNSRSPKKKLLLQQKISELSDSKFELKPIKKIRWVNSKKRAIQTVVKHWLTIVKCLEEVRNDNTFPKKQKLGAEKLENQLKDPSILAALAFVADACEELAKISLNLQKSGVTLIGKKKSREDMKLGLASLESLTGSNMKWFLGNSVIKNSERKGVKLVDFDTQQIELEGIELGKPSRQRVGDLLTSYIESLNREIDISFPVDVTDYFDIFDVSQWPTENLEAYGNAEILSINSNLDLNLDSKALESGWKDLKNSISESQEFTEMKAKTPEVFWSHYLKQPVSWTNPVRKMITDVLVVPASTAEVERIYSFYTSTKTTKRYSLDVSSVEAIVRIKVNGDPTVNNFALRAHLFVKDFILSGHARSDDTGTTGNSQISACGIAQSSIQSGNVAQEESDEYEGDDALYSEESSESSSAEGEVTLRTM